MTNTEFYHRALIKVPNWHLTPRLLWRIADKGNLKQMTHASISTVRNTAWQTPLPRINIRTPNSIVINQVIYKYYATLSCDLWMLYSLSFTMCWIPNTLSPTNVWIPNPLLPNTTWIAEYNVQTHCKCQTSQIIPHCMFQSWTKLFLGPKLAHHEGIL